MGRRIFVGNLSFNTTRETLIDVFSGFGRVTFAKVVTDHETGVSRGFGFVEFVEADTAAIARTLMNGQNLDGRYITVNEAEDRPSVERR